MRKAILLNFFRTAMRQNNLRRVYFLHLKWLEKLDFAAKYFDSQVSRLLIFRHEIFCFSDIFASWKSDFRHALSHSQNGSIPNTIRQHLKKMANIKIITKYYEISNIYMYYKLKNLHEIST